MKTELECINEVQTAIAGLQSELAHTEAETDRERARRAEAEAAMKSALPAIGESGVTRAEMRALILWMFERPDAEQQLPKALGMLLETFGLDAVKRFADFATKESPRLRTVKVPNLLAKAAQYEEILKRGHRLPPDWRPLFATNQPELNGMIDVEGNAISMTSALGTVRNHKE